mgnify:CR=1 FL=1
MNQFKKLAHAVWQCKYHIVWCPKYRFRILKGELGRSVRDIIRQLSEWRRIEILEGNVQVDHIHLVLSIPPKYSVSTIVGYLKGKSTMIIFERYSRLRRNFKGNSFWARGYFVNTVGLDEAKIRRYIKNQQTNESVMDAYDSDLDKDPFKGASNKEEDTDK